jgi:hypothetical protein
MRKRPYLCSMRIHILPGLLAIIWAQTIFYHEDFNNGVPSDWSLNTSDLGSTTTLLYNRWVVSADYNGNDVDNPISSVPADPFYCCPTNCVGFCAFLGCAAGGCTPAQIPNIPNQPAAITGGPQSAFLHVSYNPAYDNVCPPATTTFSYLAPTQFSPCYPAANLFAKKSQPVAIPATATNIKLSFFWLAGGGTNAYGEVYYSTNGTTWTQLTSRNGSQQLRNNANSWYADTISLPASVAGQNLYIGFRFVNQVGSGHADPPIGIDEIQIFGDLPGSGPTIDITSIPPVPTVCAGNSVSIAFSTTGSFGGGNQFTVQLSDATGSFAAPLAIPPQVQVQSYLADHPHHRRYGQLQNPSRQLQSRRGERHRRRGCRQPHQPHLHRQPHESHHRPARHLHPEWLRPPHRHLQHLSIVFSTTAGDILYRWRYGLIQSYLADHPHHRRYGQLQNPRSAPSRRGERHRRRGCRKPLQPHLHANPTNPTTGQPVTFTLNGSGLPTGTFNISLDIDNNGTPDYTQNGVNLPHTFTHTYTATGSYTAVFTLTHPGSGCTGTCQVTVNVGTPPPTIDITSIPPVPTVCAWQ